MNSTSETESKKKKCKTEDEDQQRNETVFLPIDLTLDIVSRLPINSLIRFRYVCQSWHTFSRDPSLVDKHLVRALINDPCLIFHNKHPLRNELYFTEFSARDDEQMVRKLQTPCFFGMSQFKIIGSCHGILCLTSSISSEVLSVYNPFTRDYKELPISTEFQAAIVQFGFGFHPTTKDYKIIKMLHYTNVSRSEVEILSLSNNVWRYIGEVPYRLEKTSGVLTPNGRLHWMSRWDYANNDNIIVSFDLSDERFLEVPKPKFIDGLPKPKFNDGQSWYNCQLVVLRGCLSAAVLVTSIFSSLDIWIMKEYNVKESWVKQFTIGGYLPDVVRQNTLTMDIVKGLLRGRSVRVLCLLKNGEILLENKYGGGFLLSYNNESGVLKKLNFAGMPTMFDTIVHVGSLNWIQK